MLRVKVVVVPDHAAHANSFGPAAETYERGRPSYPSQALDWLLPPTRRDGSDSAVRRHGADIPAGHPDDSDSAASRQDGTDTPAVGQHGADTPAGRYDDSDSAAHRHGADTPAGHPDDSDSAASRQDGTDTPAVRRHGADTTPTARQGGNDTHASARHGSDTYAVYPRVVDLGAGTGKLTRQIAARGLRVTAVDPSPGMLAELRRAVPGVTAVQGTAESLPLPPGSADVVLVAQAWHWVDASRAVPAIARVLSPGGRLGLLWNVRDESADWVRRLGEIIGSENRERSTTIGPPFGESETARFRWTEIVGPERLIDMVASRSRIILLPPDEKAAVLNEVRRLMATHPDLVGRTEYELPYITECTRADLPTE